MSQQDSLSTEFCFIGKGYHTEEFSNVEHRWFEVGFMNEDNKFEIIAMFYDWFEANMYLDWRNSLDMSRQYSELTKIQEEKGGKRQRFVR